MATAVTITEQELLDALVASVSGDAPEDARTVQEMVAASEERLSENRVRKALKAFMAQGRLRVHTVIRPAMDGRLAKVPAYTIRPAGKKK